MNNNKTNWLAVLVAAVVNMALGMAWYGFLFSKQWMAGNGVTEVGGKFFKNGVPMSESMLPMIINAFAMVVYPLFLNWIIKKTGERTVAQGATLGASFGLITWLGIWVGNMFAANPNSLTLCDGLYAFLAWTIAGAIIGGWRKR